MPLRRFRRRATDWYAMIVTAVTMPVRECGCVQGQKGGRCGVTGLKAFSFGRMKEGLLAR